MDISEYEPNGEKIKRYLTKCEELIAAVNAGTISEEDAGYDIVQMSFNTDPDPSLHPVLEPVFDAAADLEIPRTASYKQKMGTWDAKVADSIKKEEWQRLLTAIKRARVMVGY